jgi:iron complex outermembrane receptor protein
MEKIFATKKLKYFKGVKSLRVIAGMLFAMTLCNGTAQAEGTDTQHFNIQPDTMSEALTLFAMETNSQILFSPSVVENKTSGGLKGEYTQQQALDTLLAGTDLTAEKNDEKTFLIVSSEEEAAINEAIYKGESEKKGYRNAVIEEVKVTANKREQNLQDVAASLSALTGDDLNRIGAVGAQDYLAQIPGVSYNAVGRGRSPIIIRGIATGSTTFSDQQSTTAIYIDDMPSLNRWGAWTNTDPNTFDVERVEVLRGPQGTLFGSGALGGALRIINNKPVASEFQSSVDIGQSFTQGGDNSSSLNAMLNIPLIDDELALRIVGFTRNDGGYIDNIHRNEKNINSGETEGGRLLLAYTPDEDFSLALTYTHQSDIVDDGSATFRDAADGGPYEFNGIIKAASDTSMNIYNISAEYDFGALQLVSSTTYSEREVKISRDYGQVTDAFFETGLVPDETFHQVTDDVRTFAQELRLASQGGGDIQWTLGAFYLEQDIDDTELWTSVHFVEPIFQGVYLPHITEKAVFGEATYNINDQLSLTVGGRWFDNTFELEIPVYEGPAVEGSFPSPLLEESSNSFTPKVSVSYHTAEDLHFYATASEGFRIGQVNFGATPNNGVPISFGPDSLWNYELGMKSILQGGRLKLNIAAFYIDWTDIQLGRTTIADNDLAVSFTDNAGDAISKGVEVEANYIPFEQLELGTSFTYNKARLDSVLDGVDLLPGSTLPGSPEFSMSNYIQYVSEELPNNLAGYIRLSHRHVGEVVSDIVNQDHLFSDTYNAFDLRVGLLYENYEVTLYVDNLTNNDATTSRYNVGVDLDSWSTFRAYRLKPRTMGLTFRVDF